MGKIVFHAVFADETTLKKMFAIGHYYSQILHTFLSKTWPRTKRSVCKISFYAHFVWGSFGHRFPRPSEQSSVSGKRASEGRLVLKNNIFVCSLFSCWEFRRLNWEQVLTSLLKVALLILFLRKICGVHWTLRAAVPLKMKSAMQNLAFSTGVKAYLFIYFILKSTRSLKVNVIPYRLKLERWDWSQIKDYLK